MDAYQDQGRDGQPLADHIILRPDVNPFPPQRADIINGLSNLSNTVDDISSRVEQLSDHFSSLHKQVNFEHDTTNIEIDLDASSIRNHLRLCSKLEFKEHKTVLRI